jgi:Family of unknown function (DUF5994)
MTGPAAPRGTTSTLPPPSANGSAPPLAPAPQRPRRAPGGARLSLDPATARQAGIQGGWWPRSRDAAAELPGLIAELSMRAGRVSRVALQVDAFGNIPHKLTVGGRKVSVGWFRYMNKHTVILTMADRDDLVLVVIPPRASPEAAAEALGLAASGRRVGPPEAILTAAGIAVGSCGQGGTMNAHAAGDLETAEVEAADLLALARLDDDGARAVRRI